MCDKSFGDDPCNFRHVPDKFKTQNMCDKAVDEFPYNFRHVPDHFKTQAMCDKAVDKKPYYLKYVPDMFISKEMCAKAFSVNPYNFEYMPDRFKNQEMCSDKYNYSREVDDIPDWFITQEMIENSDGCCASRNNELHDWLNGYKERKAQKAQIKDELTPSAWHPDRVIDWCFDEEEKKDLKRFWGEC